MSPARLVHHELCFGCGRTNLFGLLMELEQTGQGEVRGRGFVKQDHQGPVRGTAHPGILAAALSEAMAFAAGSETAVTIELQLREAVAVGTFLEVAARVVGQTDGLVATTSQASVGAQEVASAQATYRRR